MSEPDIPYDTVAPRVEVVWSSGRAGKSKPVAPAPQEPPPVNQDVVAMTSRAEDTAETYRRLLSERLKETGDEQGTTTAGSRFGPKAST